MNSPLYFDSSSELNQPRLLFITAAKAPWTGRLISSSAKQSDLSNSPLWQAEL